jgi:Kdo2-lipid IVA lauroyltransferase/acyltransferase
VTPPLAKRLKRALRYGLLRSVLALVSRLPLGMAQRAGEAFGGLVFHLARAERHKALASLALAFPEKPEAERTRLAHDCFRHLGRCALEAAVAPRLSREAFDGLINFSPEALGVLHRALAEGRGLVAVTAHVGHWELLGWALVRHGLPLHVIAKENVDGRLTQLVDDFRSRGGVRTIWRARRGSAVAILRVLRKGEMLGLLLDQDTRVQSLFVPFFGTEASTPRAAADLVYRTGAVALVTFAPRGPDGRYHCTAAVLDVPESGDAEANALELTRRFSAATEEAIRQVPAQWVWMHQRWKTRAC